MSATENFIIAAKILYDSAPNEKAGEFVSKLAGRIAAKGEAWINANATKLHISDVEVSDQSIAPIADNRLFYLAQWQLALAEEQGS